MNLEIKEVKNAKDLKRFIYLPEKLYKNYPNWTPPFYPDELKFFNPKHNDAFEKNETIMALAWLDKKPVGRIMGVINPIYNQRKNETHARFCFLDCPDNADILNALIRFVENWACSKGMSHLIGPMAFSDKDPQGMMIYGFEEKPVIATNHNPLYLPQLIHNQGFVKLYDLVSYIILMPEQLPERYLKALERLKNNTSFKLVEFTNKRQLKPWIVPLFRLVNDAYGHIYGFDPFTEHEMKALANRYLPVLDPEFVKIIVDDDNQLLAFVVGMPELSEGIRKAKGRLLPFGWWHILHAMKNSRLLTLLLGAVHPHKRNHGFTLLLAERIINSARKNGITEIDSHLILEYNTPMRAECERLYGRLHKRYRLFIRPINAESA